MRRSLLLLALLIGCARPPAQSAAPVLASHKAAPVLASGEPEPAPPQAAPGHEPPPCRPDDGAGPATPEDHLVFLGAHERVRSSPAWGGGIDAIPLPEGFVRLKNPRRHALNPLVEAPDDEEEPEEYMSEEDRRDHVASYRFFGDQDAPVPYVEKVTVRYFRRPAVPLRGASLLRYVDTHWSGTGYTPPVADDASRADNFNWVQELVDDRGRRVVEWGYVEKGCERAEMFERFVEDGRFIWHVSMQVEPTAPAPELADWLARFFDAPFGGPFADHRAALGGQQTVR